MKITDDDAELGRLVRTFFEQLVQYGMAAGYIAVRDDGMLGFKMVPEPVSVPDAVPSLAGPPAGEWIDIKDSTDVARCYWSIAEGLKVEFRRNGGVVYCYDSAPYCVFSALIIAPSAGRYVRQELGKYKHRILKGSDSHD